MPQDLFIIEQVFLFLLRTTTFQVVSFVEKEKVFFYLQRLSHKIMKKLLLLFLFFTPSGGKGASAQADFTRIYHPIINEAELAIVDTNYYEALNFYKEAFANVKHPFAKDYYNAAICASMVGKLPLTFDYLEKIVEKGYPSDSLRKDIFFHYVADTCKQWNVFEKRMRLIKPTINWELRDSLKKLYTLSAMDIYVPLTADLRDHFAKNKTENPTTNVKLNGKDTTIAIVRQMFVDSLSFFNNLPEKLKLQQDSLRKIRINIFTKNQNKVYDSITKIIENGGYPDENLIGLSGRDSHILTVRTRISYFSEQNFNNAILNNSIVLDIFSSSFPSTESNIRPMIIKAVRDGQLLPHRINRVNASRGNTPNRTDDFSINVFTFGKVKVLQLQLETNLTCENMKDITNKKFWKKEKLGDYSETEINEKRQDIGLEKLADAYKKAFFKANPTPFIINGGNYQSELSYISSCEVLQKAIKDSVILR